MGALTRLKVRRHISIILALFLLFNKHLKEGHITKMNSWIGHGVADFVIQAHHIPAVGVIMLILIIFYIGGGINKSVNSYGCFWYVVGQ